VITIDHGLLTFTYLAPADGLTTMIKYTTSFQTKLEDLISESDYVLRYEKGNFKSGYCLLKDQKIMIVNKFYTTEGKINALLDILKIITLDTAKFTEKSQKLYEELTQTEIKA
jgi:hypothetical protein